MNDRIQELAIQAGAEYYAQTILVNGTDADDLMRKFAELIVKECANRASWAQDTNAEDIGGEVLKHFGVEE